MSNAHPQVKNRQPQKRGSSLVYAANLIGIALLMAVALNALVKFGLGPWVAKLLEKAEETAGLITNLYRLVAGIVTMLPPFLFLKRAGRKLKLEIPMGGGKVSLGLLISLFLGAMLCVNAVFSLVNTLITNITTLAPPQSQSIPEGFLGTSMYFIAVCIVPAIFEELFFRGSVQGLLQRWGPRFSIILTAVLFTLMHGSLWNIATVFILGLALSYARYISGSVSYCILLHFINNTVMFIMQLVNERLTSYAALGFSFWMILIAISLFVTAIWIIKSHQMRAVFRVEKNWPVAPGKKSRMKRLLSALFFVLGFICTIAFFIIQVIFT